MNSSTVLKSRWFHLALLAVGAVFVLSNAFHGNIWFDETFSVGICRFSFADIWRIDSGDVHPPLSYWALHVIYLIFGQDFTIYRVFTALGSVALAALGLTHVRRDYGITAGLLFTFLACFLPYVPVMASEIRMYAWVSFTVTVCVIYAIRIHRLARRGLECQIPRHFWIIFFVSSLASAYLHYFGALAALLTNLFLFAYLVAHHRVCKHSLKAFVLCAVAQLALYAPWLVVVASQVSVVSGTYWAKIVWPTTYIELATYPVLTSSTAFALRGEYGPLMQTFVTVGLWSLLACIAVVAVLQLRKLIVVDVLGRDGKPDANTDESGVDANDFPAEKEQSGAKHPALDAFHSWLARDYVSACIWGLAVYIGVLVVALAASLLMNSYFVYYRYLFVSIGPLILACSIILAHTRPRWFVALLCMLLLALALNNQSIVIRDDYSPENKEPLVYFQDTVHELEEQTDSDVLVVSSDIGFEGVTAVTYPDIDQVYMDWQHGNWDTAYECYSPQLRSVPLWEDVLNGYNGAIVVLGQANTESPLPRDITDLQQKPGMQLQSVETFYRPYERTYFSVAVFSRTEPSNAS